MLAQCLSAHPDLVVPAETDFIVPAAFVFDRVEDVEVRKTILKPLIANAAFTRASLLEYLTEHQLGEIVDAHCDSAASLFTAIYAAVARAAGAKLAGDKTPNDMLYTRILITTGAIPNDAKVIHIIRDARDVVTSLIRRGWAPGIEDFFPRLWSQTNLYLHEEFRSSPNYRLVRYEDFVRDPMLELRQLCDLLGVDPDGAKGMTAPGSTPQAICRVAASSDALPTDYRQTHRRVPLRSRPGSARDLLPAGGRRHGRVFL